MQLKQSRAKESIINDMHEAVRVGRTNSDNSPVAAELFPPCFPQGFPHFEPQNRSTDGGSLDALAPQETANY